MIEQDGVCTGWGVFEILKCGSIRVATVNGVGGDNQESVSRDEEFSMRIDSNCILTPVRLESDDRN